MARPKKQPAKPKKGVKLPTPKKKRGPVTDTAWHDAFLSAFEVSGNVRLACKAAGVNRPHAYDHRAQFPEFAKRWDDAKESAVDMLEAEARRRALSSSDTLLIFLMKSHRPEVYRETVRNEHTGRNGGPVETVSMTVDQWKSQASKRKSRVAETMAVFEGDDA